MNSLTENIERHTASKNLPALVNIREGISNTIKVANERIAEMLADTEHPKVLTTLAQKNLSEAERTFAKVQGAIDSILNSK